MLLPTNYVILKDKQRGSNAIQVHFLCLRSAKVYKEKVWNCFKLCNEHLSLIPETLKINQGNAWKDKLISLHPMSLLAELQLNNLMSISLSTINMNVELTYTVLNVGGLFFKKYRIQVMFAGPLIPLSWTSGDICSRYESQGGSQVCFLTYMIFKFTYDVTSADCVEVSMVTV